MGRCRGSHAEGQSPPNPKGWTLRSCHTIHLDRPPGRPCRRSPGLFVLSLSRSLDRDGGGLSIPGRASLASSNASAAGESIPAGDLEAAPSNASGRVDPSGWSWSILTLSSQRVSSSPCERLRILPQRVAELHLRSLDFAGPGTAPPL